MSWIRETVKTVNLLALLLICGLGYYNLCARSQQPPPEPEKEDDRVGALTVVQTENDGEDGTVTVENAEGKILIENSEPFIPTNEWQKIKPGQAIPDGLHVRMNLQTGEREARLLQDETNGKQKAQVHMNLEEGTAQVGEQKYTLDELKKVVKAMKPEEVESVDMEDLQKEREFRSYEELKKDFESMNAAIKTDSEIVTELVEQFNKVNPVNDDITDFLQQLEFYLHQIDNAVLFCDLGAMPRLLQCLNSSREDVRSEAILALGAGLQSNPKVQIAAIESGAIRELLRILTLDPSMLVRKRSMFALSTMTRHFPFAQKRFLELGGLSALTKLFEDKTAHALQVKAVTLLADLVREKSSHAENSDTDDTAHRERLRQYGEVALQEAMVETGWCRLIPSLLSSPEHDSREKVMQAMQAVLPVCQQDFQNAVPALESLQNVYKELKEEEEDGDFFQHMLSLASTLHEQLTVSSRVEL